MTNWRIRLGSYVAVAILIACAAGLFWPSKLWWKGLYLGQDRAAAHRIIYELSHYQSPYGGAPYYCSRNVEEWRQGLEPFQRAQFDQGVLEPDLDRATDADVWRIHATCVPLGRPCSEFVEVRLQDNRVTSIEARWGFMP